jgi:hypothetical protein
MHDVDGKATLRSLEEEVGKLPETYTNETAGNGLHYFFKFPEALKNVELKAKLAPGVDLKHDGYVVMPPSIVSEKAYKNINDCELAEVIRDILIQFNKAVSVQETRFEYSNLRGAVCVRIRDNHPEWSEYDLEAAYDSFYEGDAEINAMIVSVCGPSRQEQKVLAY